MFKKVIKFLASLKLAVVVILALAVVISAGTIIESRFDAQAAAKLVYHTWYMYLSLGFLALVLIAVMVDRWPWKKRHIPFLLAHVGIIVLLLGSWVTMKYGLDGTMRFGIGEKNRFVTVPATDVTIWSSFDGDRYTKLTETEVDFFLKSPEKHPFRYPLPEGELVINAYEPYVLANRQFVKSTNPKMGSAIRFQLQNPNVNVNEWLFQQRPNQVVSNQFGLAKFTLGEIPEKLPAENALFIKAKNENEISYAVAYKDPQRKPVFGTLKEGQSFPTGWMGLEFRLLRFFAKAEEKLDFRKLSRPTPISTSAVQVQFQDKKYWVQLNDVLKIFTDKAVYILTYGNRRIDLGFSLDLRNFEVGRYQGTMRAASYQSLVATPDGKETLISMNEPLKYNGLTFYQASFQEGPDQQPTASILSVNYDPGRWIKYLGSLIICLGTVWLFYNKRKAARAQAPKPGEL